MVWVFLRGTIVVMLVASVAASGCVGGGCSASNGGGFAGGGQAAICNHTDSFSYASNGGLTSKTETFSWSNTKTQANVQSGSNLGMGSVAVTISDADGKQMFSKSYSGNGQQAINEATTTGSAGTWTIKIEQRAASGQIGITVNAR